MIKIDPESLMESVMASERARGIHLSAMDELIQDYHGAHYKTTGLSDLDPAPENHAFEWLALVTPRIVFDNPTVTVSSRHSGVDRDTILRLQYGVNHWANTVGLWRTLLMAWYDEAFSFGFIRTSLNMVPGYQGSSNQSLGGLNPMLPGCRRIPPHRAIVDERCDDQREAQYMGHMWRRSKEELRGVSGFTNVDELIPDVELEKYYGSGFTTKFIQGPSRDEILGYEIWVPDHRLDSAPKNDHRYNGTIFTIGVRLNHENKKGSKPVYLRDPRPYFGPPSGPYRMFGTYRVPNSIWPLSPLVATFEQVKELNAHAVSAARSAAGFKRFTAYDTSHPEAGAAAKDANHNDVVGINGLADGMLKEITNGGVDPAVLQYLSLLRERRDRVTGLNDAARGVLNENMAGSSATAAADLAAQRDSRLAFIERMFHEDTRAVLDHAGWYMFNSEFVRFSLPDSAAQEIKPRPRMLPQEDEAEDIAIRFALPMGEEEDPYQLSSMPYMERVEKIRESLTWQPKVGFPADDGAEGQTEYKSMSDMTGLRYEDLQLIIDPLSMARTDQALLQKRVQDQFSLVTKAALLMPQTPYLDWVDLFDTWGDALNQKDFSAIIKLPILKQFQQMYLQQAQMASQPDMGQDPLGNGGEQGATSPNQYPMMGGEDNGSPAAMQRGQMMGELLADAAGAR